MEKKRKLDDTVTSNHIRFEDDENEEGNNEEFDNHSAEKSNNDKVDELDILNPVDKASARIRKQRKKARVKNTKRGRLIVRNLSFKTTEETLKNHFEQFGTVIDVKLLKRPDGKLVGCGFVQYEVVQNAAKALYHLSGKPFLGRNIVCDWALGKTTFVKNMEDELKKEIKTEDGGTIEINDDCNIESTTDPDLSIVKSEDVEVKEERDDDNDEKLEVKSEDSDSSNSDEDDSETEEEQDESDKNDIEEPKTKKPRVESNDIQEGKTVFIRNLPFSATNEDLKECMLQFGPFYYALVCIDKLTEYSKGTGFVKFKNLEDAEKCIASSGELILKGNVLECQKAISKNDIEQKNKKPEVKRDSRHLYLVKEGVILAGSKGAQSVSATDMAKRLELERWKTQILRNLNMFISLYRLIIHNLPSTYDDKQLRALFTKYAGPKAVIKEAKVMKDFRNLGLDGKPVSKEYGFVSFAKHEDALKALRAINNNPNIFTKAKRPIVAFSIENKSVMNAKAKRLLKSKQYNPNCKDFDPETLEKDKELINDKAKNIPTNEYSGVAAKPGVSKMRSKFKLLNQAKLHQERLKEEKRRMKLTRKSIKKKKMDYLKQSKQKKGKRKYQEKDNFSKIVNKYTKTSNKSNASAKKQKWYDS